MVCEAAAQSGDKQRRRDVRSARKRLAVEAAADEASSGSASITTVVGVGVAGAAAAVAPRLRPAADIVGGAFV